MSSQEQSQPDKGCTVQGKFTHSQTAGCQIGHWADDCQQVAEPASAPDGAEAVVKA